ncbi:hypothetical protein [Desulfotomaculum nigrificans]|uniref:hypothetical protein n=1 Tax=Desulfotomaculum nigrificans TaxID=1565 RepID=UPI0003126529|nr:hypothetical protein [Desulfotomaculum nigrificans]
MPGAGEREAYLLLPVVTPAVGVAPVETESRVVGLLPAAPAPGLLVPLVAVVVGPAGEVSEVRVLKVVDR